MEIKRMDCKVIYNKVVKRGITLQEIASSDDWNYEFFMQKLEESISPTLFRQIKKADEETQKNREKAPNKNTFSLNSTAMVIEKSEIEKLREEKTKLFKEECSISEQIEQFKIAKISDEMVASQCKDVVGVAQKNYEEAKKTLEKAKWQFNKAESKIAERNKKIAELSASLEEVLRKEEETEGKIAEIENSRIFLVFPGYSGELPRRGKFFSTKLIPGRTDIQIDAGDELLEEPSLYDISKSGFESISDFMVAIEFVKLCIKYWLEDSNVNFLIGDERVNNLLLQQGIAIV